MSDSATREDAVATIRTIMFDNMICVAPAVTHPHLTTLLDAALEGLDNASIQWAFAKIGEGR